MVMGDPKWARYHAAGHPTYHVNVVKLKWEIIWTGALSHLLKWVTSPTWGPPPPCKQALKENFVTRYKFTFAIWCKHDS